MQSSGATDSALFPTFPELRDDGRTRRRGWVFLDVLTGLMIVAILAATLGTAVAARERALHHLADIRAAQRLAESALICLQSGEIAPVGSVAVRELADAPANPRNKWVEVTATVNGREAQIVGLVPKGPS